MKKNQMESEVYYLTIVVFMCTLNCMAQNVIRDQSMMKVAEGTITLEYL
ncbi:hypothetical protein NXW86_29765 [Bacteroides thetaiotaomicron]|nr:hypothetical protein [Bacteroides thetaiotaomicron]MCS2453154.1 hypothetical protein [Bacteroides thetaiotaomicron]